MSYRTHKIKSAVIFSFIMLLVGSGIISLLPAKPALAATSGEWLDKTSIVYNYNGTDYTFYDSNIYDDNNTYLSNTQISGCTGQISMGDLTNTGGGSTGVFSICNQQDQTISLTHRERRFVNAYQVDANTIFMPQYLAYKGLSSSATNTVDNGNVYVNYKGYFVRYATDTPFCKGVSNSTVTSGQYNGLCSLFVDQSEKAVGTGSSNPLTYAPASDYNLTGEAAQWIDTNQNKEWVQYESAGGALGINTFSDYKTNLVLANYPIDSRAGYGTMPTNPNPIDQANSGNTGAPGTGTGGTTASQQIQLNCNVDLNPLTWLICPLVDAAQGLIGVLDTQINQLLVINACSYFNASGGGVDTQTTSGCNGQDQTVSNAFYNVWGTLRDIALGVVVIAALIMVISQALGFEFIDAYTIRKVLPRMLIAVIGISLSWQILQFLINLSNDLGFGIRDLISTPFTSVFKNGIQISQTGSSALALIGGVSLLGLGLVGLGTVILIALLSVVVAFILLTFRVILIVFLAVFAPLAIAFYILPGTSKIWKFWWENFSKLLIMFPLIAGMIAIGRDFALVTTNSGSQGLIQEVTAFVCYFGPYLIIPFTFRFSGGIMAATGSLVTKAQQGISKPLRRSAAGRLPQRAAEARAGKLFSGRDYIPGSTAVARRLNAVSRGVAMGGRGSFGLGRRGEQGATQGIINGATETMKSAGFQGISNYDDALMAGTYDTASDALTMLSARYQDKEGLGKAEADSRALDAVRAVQASGNKFGDRSFQYASAQQLVNTGTGYKDLEDMTETLARASGGSSSVAAGLTGFANSAAKQTGRWDLAPSYGTLNGLTQSRLREISGQGSGPTLENYAEASVKASRGADSVTLLRGKPDQVKNLSTALGNHFTKQWEMASDQSLPAEQRSAAKHEAIETFAQIVQLDRSKIYASAENQNHVNNLLSSTERVRNEITNLVRTQPGTPPTTDEQKLWQTLVPPISNNPDDPRNI